MTHDRAEALYRPDLEAALLGAVLAFPERTLHDVLGTGLRPDDFYVPRFRRAWAAICALEEDGEPVDLFTVDARLSDRTTIAEAVYEQAQVMPSHAPAWASQIGRLASARALLERLDVARAAVEIGDVDTAFAVLAAACSAADRRTPA